MTKSKFAKDRYLEVVVQPFLFNAALWRTTCNLCFIVCRYVVNMSARTNIFTEIGSDELSHA